jgi:hypothetical protein
VETIKIITWNMAHNAANWQTVLDSNIDVALLQEALVPPNQLRDEFIICEEDEGVKSGHTWRTMVAGLVGSEIIDFVPIKTQPLGGNDPSALMVSRPGSLSAAL